MDENGKMQEITTRDYIRVLFRQKWVFVASFVTMMATVIAGVLMKTPVYQSEVTMLISGQKRSQTEYYTDVGLIGVRSNQISMTQSQIVQSDPVIERAVAVLGLAEKPLDYEARFSSFLKRPIVKFMAKRKEAKFAKFSDEQKKAVRFRYAMEDLRQNLSVEPIRETELFRIEVKDFNPAAAMITANVVSRSYAIFDLEQQMAEMQLKYGDKNLSVIQLKEAIEKLAKGLNGAPLPAIDAIGPASVKIIEQAKVPIRPSGLSRLSVVVLASFMSLFLSVLVAFSFEYLDQTFKSPNEVENILNANYLGSLPKKAVNGHFHDLGQNLYLAMKDTGARSVTFTSVMANGGVTDLVCKLGLHMAQDLDKKVLLIDGNLRHPSVHSVFDLPESKDFANVLEGKATMEQSVRSVAPNLDIITSGYSVVNPINVLDAPVMKFLLEKARQKYDLVLIDAPALEKVKDAVILAGISDGVVVALNEGQTRRQVAKSALDTLNKDRTRLFGVVLNNRKYVIPSFIYDRV
jgi:capsular exopolysaccharide synthesis family protein